MRGLQGASKRRGWHPWDRGHPKQAAAGGHLQGEGSERTDEPSNLRSQETSWSGAGGVRRKGRLGKAGCVWGWSGSEVTEFWD